MRRHCQAHIQSASLPTTLHIPSSDSLPHLPPCSLHVHVHFHVVRVDEKTRDNQMKVAELLERFMLIWFTQVSAR